jgi:VanZ family protein
MSRTEKIVEDTALRSDFATKRKWGWFVVACVATAGVLLVSYLPQGMMEPDLRTGIGDKIPHAAAYFVLTWCWLKVCGGGCGRGRMLVVIFVPIAIGTVAELTQPLAGRVCDLMDWVANVVGVGVACVYWMIRKR